METTTVEVPTTEEVEITHCDGCGMDTEGGLLYLPVYRGEYEGLLDGEKHYIDTDSEHVGTRFCSVATVSKVAHRTDSESKMK